MSEVGSSVPGFQRAHTQPAVTAQHQVKLWYETHVLLQQGQGRQHHQKETLGGNEISEEKENVAWLFALYAAACRRVCRSLVGCTGCSPASNRNPPQQRKALG